MLNLNQYREYILYPYLEAIDSNYPNVAKLIEMICAHESKMGTYLHQVNGPAVGIYQQEPKWYNSSIIPYIEDRAILKQKILSKCAYAELPSSDQLIANHGFATMICRVHFMRFSDPIPNENDLYGLAAYWKKYYNTESGAGTINQFLYDYNKIINN